MEKSGLELNGLEIYSKLNCYLSQPLETFINKKI